MSTFENHCMAPAGSPWPAVVTDILQHEPWHVSGAADTRQLLSEEEKPSRVQEGETK